MQVRTDAGRLANAIRQINLAKPSGRFNCAGDVGEATMIGLSYPRRSDVGLWYQSSGCQTLDNGRIGAFQGANPSFYTGFETTVDQLVPPVVER